MVRTRNRGAHASGQRAALRGTWVKGARAGDRRVGDERLSRVLPRAARVRVAAIATVVALLAIGVAVGLGSPRPSAEPTVQSFLLNWENGQYRAAAALTTGDPVTVARSMSAVYQQLDADDLSLGLGRISQHGNDATARFNATVNLGPGGAAWNYQGSFALRRMAGSWKVLWSPATAGGAHHDPAAGGAARLGGPAADGAIAGLRSGRAPRRARSSGRHRRPIRQGDGP